VTRAAVKKPARKAGTRVVGVPRDLARHHLLQLADELRADAERRVPAFGGDRKLETPPPWLLFAAEVLAAVADGTDPRTMIDGNAQGIPRILAFEAVLAAATDGAPNLLASFQVAARALRLGEDIIETHFGAELALRGTKPSDYLVFSGKQKRRARTHKN
jgi:hypothetical protein